MNQKNTHARKIFIFVVLTGLLFSALSMPNVPIVSAQEPAPTDDVSGQIVGGVPADPGEWAWQVALIGGTDTDFYDGQFCGGSLIAPQWVVTAAHCVDGFATADVDIVAGIYDLYSPAPGYQRRNVTEIHIHPSYNIFPDDSDIALLKLESVVAIGGSGETKTALVPMVASDVGDLKDKTSWATGWGNTESIPALPDELYEVSVPIIANSLCNDASHYNGDITSNMLCAGLEAGGKDTCQGDSGGPLVVYVNNKWQLAGISSWGIGCADPGNYGVYTRVSEFANWIDDYVPTDLIVNSINISPATIYTNDDVDIFIEGQNIGSSSTGAFTVNFYIDGTPANIPPTTTCNNTERDFHAALGSLSANEIDYWNITLPAGSLSVGSHTITAYIDSTCAVTETGNETNNVFATTFTVNAAPVAAPANDSVSTPTEINNLPYAPAALDVRGATRHAGDPTNISCPKVGDPSAVLEAGMASVWYQYTPAADMTVYIDTSGTNYDTYIAVWQGTPNTTLVGCNDDVSGLQSGLQVDLTGGTTYYFEVAEFSFNSTDVLANSLGKSSVGNNVEAQAAGSLVFDVSIVNLKITPSSSLDFGNQLFRTSNPAQQVTVKNTSGGSDITLGSLSGSSSVGTTADTGKSFFISSDTCSANVLVLNEECSFNVTFLPWSLGAKTGSISIPSNAPDSPHVISLKGNSVAGSQLLLNRSFESFDGNGMPNLWSRSPLVKIGLDGTDLTWAFNLTHSMKFVGDGDLKIITQQVNKPGVAGDDFSMFVVTKGNNIPAGSDRWLMQIMFYNGATIVENRNVNLAIGTHTDSRRTVMYTATTPYTHIMFRVHYGKASGTAWVDLASLQWAP